jgi:hypothetical protein
MHSLEVVSGLGMGILYWHQAKFNLISCRRNYEIRFYRQDEWPEG